MKTNDFGLPKTTTVVAGELTRGEDGLGAASGLSYNSVMAKRYKGQWGGGDMDESSLQIDTYMTDGFLY